MKHLHIEELERLKAAETTTRRIVKELAKLGVDLSEEYPDMNSDYMKSFHDIVETLERHAEDLKEIRESRNEILERNYNIAKDFTRHMIESGKLGPDRKMTRESLKSAFNIWARHVSQRIKVSPDVFAGCLRRMIISNERISTSKGEFRIQRNDETGNPLYSAIPVSSGKKKSDDGSILIFPKS